MRTAGLFAAVFAGSLLRAGDDLELLREQVRRALELRQAAHATESRWAGQRPGLRRERDVLDRRIRQLEERLAAKEREAAAARKDLAALQAAVRSRRLALDALGARLATAEQSLDRLRPLLPPVLADSLKGGFADLDRFRRAAGPDAMARRLRLVCGLLTEIGNFDHGIHDGRQVLTPTDGKPREMDVLYAGLAAAWAVSDDNRVAGIGTPGPGGWHWRWEASFAEPVRRLLEIYRKERPAAFVELPLRLVSAGAEPVSAPRDRRPDAMPGEKSQ